MPASLSDDAAGMQKCLACGLLNPETAERCDCGYDFPTGKIFKPYPLNPTKHKQGAISPIQKFRVAQAGWVLFLFLLSLIAIRGDAFRIWETRSFLILYSLACIGTFFSKPLAWVVSIVFLGIIWLFLFIYYATNIWAAFATNLFMDSPGTGVVLGMCLLPTWGPSFYLLNLLVQNRNDFKGTLPKIFGFK